MKFLPSAQVNINEPFQFNFRDSVTPTSPGQFISWILPQVYVVALMALFLYLIWGGYRYLLSAGDPKAIQGAKQHLTYAVVGLIVIFLAYWMFNVVDYLLFDVF